MKFSHSLKTTASPDRIWSLWTDVEHWHYWDTELITATLNSDFALNAHGQLQPKNGPKSTFVISELNSNHSYTFTTQLPLCRLHVKRFLTLADHYTLFTHEVSFEGRLSFLFGRLLGQQFREVLPTVMANLRNLAEAEQ